MFAQKVAVIYTIQVHKISGSVLDELTKGNPQITFRLGWIRGKKGENTGTSGWCRAVGSNVELNTSVVIETVMVKKSDASFENKALKFLIEERPSPGGAPKLFGFIMMDLAPYATSKDEEARFPIAHTESGKTVRLHLTIRSSLVDGPGHASQPPSSQQQDNNKPQPETFSAHFPLGVPFGVQGSQQPNSQRSPRENISNKNEARVSTGTASNQPRQPTPSRVSTFHGIGVGGKSANNQPVESIIPPSISVVDVVGVVKGLSGAGVEKYDPGTKFRVGVKTGLEAPIFSASQGVGEGGIVALNSPFSVKFLASDVERKIKFVIQKIDVEGSPDDIVTFAVDATKIQYESKKEFSFGLRFPLGNAKFHLSVDGTKEGVSTDARDLPHPGPLVQPVPSAAALKTPQPPQGVKSLPTGAPPQGMKSLQSPPPSTSAKIPVPSHPTSVVQGVGFQEDRRLSAAQENALLKSQILALEEETVWLKSRLSEGGLENRGDVKKIQEEKILLSLALAEVNAQLSESQAKGSELHKKLVESERKNSGILNELSILRRKCEDSELVAKSKEMEIAVLKKELQTTREIMEDLRVSTKSTKPTASISVQTETHTHHSNYLRQKSPPEQFTGAILLDDDSDNDMMMIDNIVFAKAIPMHAGEEVLTPVPTPSSPSNAPPPVVPRVSNPVLSLLGSAQQESAWNGRRSSNTPTPTPTTATIPSSTVVTSSNSNQYNNNKVVGNENVAVSPKHLSHHPTGTSSVLETLEKNRQERAALRAQLEEDRKRKLLALGGELPRPPSFVQAAPSSNSKSIGNGVHHVPQTFEEKVHTTLQEQPTLQQQTSSTTYTLHPTASSNAMQRYKELRGQY